MARRVYGWLPRRHDGVSVSRVLHFDEPAAAIAAIRRLQRWIVTFTGFSGGGYEDPRFLERVTSQQLACFDPARTTICSGATADGIGSIYPLAKIRGFDTIGIVSSVAETDGVRYSDCVDIVYVIKDETWGGLRTDAENTLRPTSEVMVATADEMIAIGGGEVAYEEVREALERDKNVRYVPAEMNHAAAIQRAARNGEPSPVNFKGRVDSLFMTT